MAAWRGFLVFRSEDDIPDRNRRAGALSDLPDELLAAVQAVATVGAGQAAGNLVAMGGPNVRPSPLSVPMDADALAIFDDLDQDMTRRQRIAVGSEQSAVLARVWENTAKVALVKAVSANPAEPVIRGVDAQWAREVVDHCVATLLIQAGRHLADNEIERLHKRVIELIRAAGAKWHQAERADAANAVHRAQAASRDSADADRERSGCQRRRSRSAAARASSIGCQSSRQEIHQMSKTSSIDVTSGPKAMKGLEQISFVISSSKSAFG